MKNAAIVLCTLFALFVGCNALQTTKSPRTAFMTEYHATPYFTEVEWDIVLGETAQMALYSETIYITPIKEKNGRIKLLLKVERAN